MHTHLPGPGFRRRLLADLQHLARRSLLYLKRSLHLFLQSAVPLQEISRNKGAQLSSECLPPEMPQSQLCKEKLQLQPSSAVLLLSSVGRYGRSRITAPAKSSCRIAARVAGARCSGNNGRWSDLCRKSY